MYCHAPHIIRSCTPGMLSYIHQRHENPILCKKKKVVPGKVPWDQGVAHRGLWARGAHAEK